MGKDGARGSFERDDDDKHEYVVAYATRSNDKAEDDYLSYEGEVLALVWAVTHFRHFFYGKPFSVITDHHPLEWVLPFDKLTRRHARWSLILREQSFKIIHRPGLKHANDDVC